MLVAKVIGTVVCTRKDERLLGRKLLVVEPVNPADQKASAKPLVAIDTVGAGINELVLLVSGSSARQTDKTKDTPTDTIIMAIIDSIELEGEIVFRKN